MDEIFEFIVNVTVQVWQKIKKNAVLIVVFSIPPALLLMPALYVKCPWNSMDGLVGRPILLLLTFIAVYIYYVTIKNINIDASFFKTYFKFISFGKPLVAFLSISVLSGIIIAVFFAPQIFFYYYPLLKEKIVYYALFQFFPIFAILSLFITLPNFIVFIFNVFEGKDFKEAEKHAFELCGCHKKEIFFLFFTLLLIMLGLNIVNVAFALLFPAIMLFLGEAYAQLDKIDTLNESGMPSAKVKTGCAKAEFPADPKQRPVFSRVRREEQDGSFSFEQKKSVNAYGDIPSHKRETHSSSRSFNDNAHMPQRQSASSPYKEISHAQEQQSRRPVHQAVEQYKKPATAAYSGEPYRKPVAPEEQKAGKPADISVKAEESNKPAAAAVSPAISPAVQPVAAKLSAEPPAMPGKPDTTATNIVAAPSSDNKQNKPAIPEEQKTAKPADISVKAEESNKPAAAAVSPVVQPVAAVPPAVLLVAAKPPSEPPAMPGNPEAAAVNVVKSPSSDNKQNKPAMPEEQKTGKAADISVKAEENNKPAAAAVSPVVQPVAAKLPAESPAMSAKPDTAATNIVASPSSDNKQNKPAMPEEQKTGKPVSALRRPSFGTSVPSSAAVNADFTAGAKEKNPYYDNEPKNIMRRADNESVRQYRQSQENAPEFESKQRYNDGYGAKEVPGSDHKRAIMAQREKKRITDEQQQQVPDKFADQERENIPFIATAAKRRREEPEEEMADFSSAGDISNYISKHGGQLKSSSGLLPENKKPLHVSDYDSGADEEESKEKELSLSDIFDLSDKEPEEEHDLGDGRAEDLYNEMNAMKVVEIYDEESFSKEEKKAGKSTVVVEDLMGSFDPSEIRTKNKESAKMGRQKDIVIESSAADNLVELITDDDEEEYSEPSLAKKNEKRYSSLDDYGYIDIKKKK